MACVLLRTGMPRTYLFTSSQILKIIAYVPAPAVHVMDARGAEFTLSLYGLQFREATPEEVRKFWKLRRNMAAIRGQVERN